MKRITLLSDFGTADGYVAGMKGAITEIAPSVLIDDASHDIRHGDIVAAALTLRRYWQLYPEGTVHVVVVDPGVGTERRGVIVDANGRYFVGPDNGVFTFVLEDARYSRVYEIAVAGFASSTFHGRDIFAPTAARLAAGAKAEDLGTEITDAVRIALPPPIATESSVLGEIVHIDHFGNLISNIPKEMIRASHVGRIAERDIRFVDTYGDAEPGEVVALINSDGVVEVALRDGNAAHALVVERGAPLELI